MQLPNAEEAVVEVRKITEYLLNDANPDNGGKAPYFRSLGFRIDEPAIFIAALRQMAVVNEVSSSVSSPHGVKYTVDGPLAGPLRRATAVRTVWIVDAGTTRPRLITAYPAD